MFTSLCNIKADSVKYHLIRGCQNIIFLVVSTVTKHRITAIFDDGGSMIAMNIVTL